MTNLIQATENQQNDVDPTILQSVHAMQSDGDSLKPSVETERAYRDALGSFGTGVTLITTTTDQSPIGMTVNSFASVSLDPALVLWSVAKRSGRYEAFRNASNFAIHILAENQYDLAMAFAKNADAFEPSEWDFSKGEIPLAKKALARFECQTQAVHDGGDHSIMIGRVQRFSQRQGLPLLFTAGKFGTFVRNDTE